MKVEEALAAMRKGKKVRRKNMYPFGIEIIKGGIWEHICLGDHTTPAHIKATILSDEDRLAEDWETVDD